MVLWVINRNVSCFVVFVLGRRSSFSAKYVLQNVVRANGGACRRWISSGAYVFFMYNFSIFHFIYIYSVSAAVFRHSCKRWITGCQCFSPTASCCSKMPRSVLSTRADQSSSQCCWVSIRGIDCYAGPHTILIATFFDFGDMVSLVDRYILNTVLRFSVSLVRALQLRFLACRWNLISVAVKPTLCLECLPHSFSGS